VSVALARHTAHRPSRLRLRQVLEVVETVLVATLIAALVAALSTAWVPASREVRADRGVPAASRA